MHEIGWLIISFLVGFIVGFIATTEMIEEDKS